MKGQFNDIKLGNITRNFNERIYLQIFARKICTKYCKISGWFYLSTLCNDDRKYARKNSLKYFYVNVSQIIIVSSNFFRESVFWNFYYRSIHQSLQVSRFFDSIFIIKKQFT